MRLLAVVSYFAFFCSGTAVARQGYTNPVRDSNGDMVRVADPFVYRHGGVYYLIGTTRQHNGFDCYTSPDLVHWTFAGAAYTKPDGHYGTGSFWAPEVKYYNGKFYLTYSAYNPANRKLLSSLAVSDRPDGPFTDARGKTPLLTANEQIPCAYDPDIILPDKDDPNAYIVFCGGWQAPYWSMQLKQNMTEVVPGTLRRVYVYPADGTPEELTGELPLVLHGGTGIPADQIKKAIDLGVSKINVNTECQLAFADATRKYIEAGKDLEGKGFDPRKLLAPGAEAIKATVKEKMELFGSVGKAE